GKADLARDVASCLKIGVRFAGEPNDDIRGESRLVQRHPQASAALQEPGDAVTAVHPLQDSVRSALQAEVKMRANAPRLGQRVDQFALDFGRLQAAQAYAKISRQLVQPPDQVPEPAPMGFRLAATEVDTVMTQVYAGQDDLLAARFDQVANFICDFVKR